MEIAVNNFIGGLNLDSHPSAVSQNNLTDALNATVRTYNGNELMLQNDMGNTMIQDARTGTTVGLSEGFIPLGMKEHGGVLYIASYNPKTKEGELGSIPSPLITYTLAQPETNTKEALLTYTEGTSNIIESFANNTLTKISENIYSPGDCFLIVLNLEAEQWTYTAQDKIWDFNKNKKTGDWADFPVITKNADKQNKGLFRIELYAETQNDAYLIGSTKSKNCLYYIKNNLDPKHSNYWFILKSDLDTHSIDARRTLASNNFVSYPNVPEGSLSIKAAVEKPEITGFIKNSYGLNEPFVVHASYTWGENGEIAYQYYMTVTALEGVVSAWPIDKIKIRLQELESKKDVFDITLRNDASNALSDEDIPIDLKLKTSRSNAKYNQYCTTNVNFERACENSLAYTSTFTQFKQGEKLYISNKWQDEQTLLDSVDFDSDKRLINPLFIYALDLQDNYKPFTFTIEYYYTQDDNDYLIDTKYFYYTPIFTEKMPYKPCNGDQVTIGSKISQLQSNIEVFSPCEDNKTYYCLLPIKDGEVMQVNDWTSKRNLAIPNIGIQFNFMAGIYATNDEKLFKENKGTITSVSLCLIGITPNDAGAEQMGKYFYTFKENQWSDNQMGWNWAGNIAAHLDPATSISTSYLYSPRYFRTLSQNTVLHEYSGTDQKFLTAHCSSSKYIPYTECAQRGVYQTDFKFSKLTNYFRNFKISSGIRDATCYDVFTPHWDGTSSQTLYLERKQYNGQQQNMSTFDHFCDIWNTYKQVAGFNGKTGGVEAIRDISWLTFNGSVAGYGGLRSQFYPQALNNGWEIPGEQNIKDSEFNIETQYELFLATIFHVYGVKDTEVFFKSRYHQKTCSNGKPISGDNITLEFNRTYKICKTNYSKNYWESFFTSALSDDLKPKLVVHAPELHTFEYQNNQYDLFQKDTLSDTVMISSGEYELDGGSVQDTLQDGVTISKSEDNVYTINYTKSKQHYVYNNKNEKKNIYKPKYHGSDDFYAWYLKDKFYIDLDTSITEIDRIHIQNKLLKTDSYLYYQTIGGDIINTTAYNTDDVTVKDIITVDQDSVDLRSYLPATNFSSSSFNSDWNAYFYFKDETPISCDYNAYYKIVGAQYTNDTWQPLSIDDCIQQSSNSTITVPSNCIVKEIHKFDFNEGYEDWFLNRKDEIFGECCVIAEQGLQWENTSYKSIMFPQQCDHLIITNIVPVTEKPTGSNDYKVKTSVKLEIK